MSSTRKYDTQTVYHIRVKGILGQEWSHWMGGLAISAKTDGEMLLTGPIADQAALHGILNKIRDLNLTLLSLERVEE